MKFGELIAAVNRVSLANTELLTKLPEGAQVRLEISGRRGDAWLPEPTSILINLTWPKGNGLEEFQIDTGIWEHEVDEFSKRLSKELHNLKALIK